MSDSSNISTTDLLSDLDNVINDQETLYNILIPEIKEVSKRLVNTSQQYQYLIATRHEGCIPEGIAKQSRFTYSGKDKAFQQQLQKIYYYAASRTLDMIILDVHRKILNFRNIFYSKVRTVEHLCNNSGISFLKIQMIIKSTMHKEKLTCIARHNKKLQRDKCITKLYINPSGTSPNQITPNNIIENVEVNNNVNIITRSNNNPKKKTRRFTKDCTNKRKPRVPKFRARRKELKQKTTLAIPSTINVDKYYHNLTNFELNNCHKFIFCLGQKFCPTPIGADWAAFETSIDNWTYVLRYAVKYCNNNIICDNDNSDPTYERLLIKKQTYKPIHDSGRPALELYIQKVREELLSSRPTNDVSPNLSKENLKALKELKYLEKDHDIIIRPYDKGQVFFLITKSHIKIEF